MTIHQDSLINQVFGKLTVIGEAVLKPNGRTGKFASNYPCKCSCGNPEIKYFRPSHLKNGAMTSCGCNKGYHKNHAKGEKCGSYKHGLSTHPLYRSWLALRKYASKNSKSFVKEDIIEWKNFSEFYDWGINVANWSNGKNIVRLDINKSWNKDNCKFVEDKDWYKYIDFKLNTKESREKIKETNLKKYGSISPFGNKEIKKKAQNTVITKYGKIFNQCKGFQQKSVQDWLTSLGFEFKSDHKILNGKEIDLYNEKLKLGIEYCGIHWHTERYGRMRNYHLDKLKKCNEQGIRLITIFNDEWLYHTKQCKNFLKSVLGVQDKKIFARKCLIKEVNCESAIKFINDNHIQGSKKKALIYFGLYYEDELVGVVSISRHHRNNDKSIAVLQRLCFIDGLNIVGGSSRLFSACKDWAKKEGFSKIVSWSDNRWSEGNIYKVLGFKLEKELAPDYSYVELNGKIKRLGKQSCQKKKINCSSNKTEGEFMKEKGYSRIWDCGKKRWVYDVV